MKKIILALLLALPGGAVLAQDIIMKRNAVEIEAVVTKVGTDEIEYRRWDNPEGPVYTIAKDEVFLIKYRNGSKDLFDEPASRPKRSELLRGYQGELAAGYGLGIGWFSNLMNTNRIVVETVHGYRVNPYFFAGAGIGVDYFHRRINLSFSDHWGTRYDFTYTGGLVMPLFADFKGYCPVGRKASLYLSWDIGAAFGVAGWAEGTEFYTCAGPGIDFGSVQGAPRGDLSVRFQYMGEGMNAILFRVGIKF